MSGMGNMGRMKGSPRMATQSAMPGFPGESHLYHIGATGFFLDHPQHTTLTQEQQTRLNQIREKALLNDATTQRRIDQAEQDLYALTGADQPDEAKIQAKVKEIANLGVEKTLAYIRAVGEAAQVLTDEQRRELLGKVPMEMKK
jgi:Spy/CpxP family protein refolding chaperone